MAGRGIHAPALLLPLFSELPRRVLLGSPVNKRGALPYTLLQEIANALSGQFINLCLRAKMPSLIFGTNYKAYP
jgi:hypothetical protein